MTGPGKPAVEGIYVTPKPPPVIRGGIGIHAVVWGMGEGGGVEDKKSKVLIIGGGR